MNYTRESLIKWLLQGDVAIQFQVHRDLMGQFRPDLQGRIAEEGWGKKFLQARHYEGHWGQGFYQPKWTSTHYTLLDLCQLGLSPDQEQVKQSLELIITREKGSDGGINPAGSVQQSDVCINGMFLNYASYFGMAEAQLQSVVDFILSQKMPDGGFNCRLNRSGARHSSLHSTLSVLEGIWQYSHRGYQYRQEELKHTTLVGQEFILTHRLFLSDRTGDIIRKDFLRYTYPARWKYNILSALCYFTKAGARWDSRMEPALDHLLKKRRKEGSWNLAARHPGHTHFDMEQAGKPSRWNTLRALTVLQHFQAI